MSYSYSAEEELLPEWSGVGNPRPCYTAYLAAQTPMGGSAGITDWLNAMAVDGWELITVDNHMAYFKKSEFRVYEETPEGLVRVKPGQNS